MDFAKVLNITKNILVGIFFPVEIILQENRRMAISGSYISSDICSPPNLELIL